MAILEMEKIFVYGLHSNRKAVLEELHKKEVMEVSEQNIEELNYRETAKSVSQFDEFMRSAETALGILDEYAPEKSSFFSNRRILPMQKYSMKTAESDMTLKSVYEIIRLSEKIREHAESSRQVTVKQAALEPYLTLDIPMNINYTGYTRIRIGSFQGMKPAEQLKKELAVNDLNGVHCEILCASKEYTYVWLAYLKGQEEKVSLFLQNMGFSEPGFSLSRHSPQEKKEILEDEKNRLKKEIIQYTKEMKGYSDWRSRIELFYDHMRLRREKYQILSRVGMTEHTFFLEGYIPKKYIRDIQKSLEDKYTVYVELRKPEGTEEVPAAFQNNAFAAPVETITETYSMPSDIDIDPNPIMAFFYYLFFGMMFSDAGYGLLLMLVCGYLGFSKRLEKPKRKNFKMFFFCGISTAFWGLMYGSFFGNMIGTVSVTFFHKDITFAPIWMDPVSEPLKLLIFSIALGMFQLLTGLCIKFYMLCRQKKVLDALFDIGFWVLVLLGICSLAAGMGLGIPVLIEIGKYTAIISAAGLVFTGGRKGKNIVSKLFGGIIGLYDITGYVSDVLSYSRLMALGLATGVIAGVVNILGSMSGNSVIGVIMFVVISIVGHSMNFAINMLGAYVHTNRLQYVEFFSKFYEGGGRKFAPFRMNTKYHQFSEE